MKENRTQGKADHTSAMHSDHMEFGGCQHKLRPLYFVHKEIEKINFQIWNAQNDTFEWKGGSFGTFSYVKVG